MHDFKINQIRAFVTIVELGGFHAAAKVLHKTQPAISQAIHSLEVELDQPLFEKDNKKNLTQFGHYFLEHARDFLEYHDNIRDLIYNEQQRKYFSVTIAILPSIAQNLLPKLIQAFQQKHPNIRLNIRDASNAQIIKLIRQQKVDFAICALNHLDEEFSTELLLEDDFGLVCHKNNLKILDRVNTKGGDKPSLEWQDVISMALIKNGTWNILPYELRGDLEKNSMMSVVNMSSLNALLNANAGITVLPELAYDANNNDLRFIKINQRVLSNNGKPNKQAILKRQLGLVTLKNASISHSAEKLYQEIKLSCHTQP